MKKWDEIKILYVEDEELTRNSLGRFLKRRFGRVFLAEDGENGLEMFAAHTPDICIVDILLPKINGLDMIRKMKAINSECKFLITSSVSDVDTILKAVDLKIENYIIKPLDTDDLEIKLNTLAFEIMAEREEKNRLHFFSEIESRSETTEDIRKSIIAIIKDAAGKGPRDISIFFSEDTVEIDLYGTLTTFEQTVLNRGSNKGHIEEGRKIFYSIIEKRLSDIIEEKTKVRSHISSIKLDYFKGKEILIFTAE